MSLIGIKKGTKGVDFKRIMLDYQCNFQVKAATEIEWFRRQPSLEHAIEKAALSIRHDGKRYSHQARHSIPVLKAGHMALLSKKEEMIEAETFHDLFMIVHNTCDPISGLGELYIYDIALRIGAYLNLFPDKIYLHIGTRMGSEELGLNTERLAIEMEEFPEEITRIAKPLEIEDIMCLYKTFLKEAHEIEKSRRKAKNKAKL